MNQRLLLTIILLVTITLFVQPQISPAMEPVDELPSYLMDRGTGSPTSMFGTHIRKGELMLYPFYEYYINAQEEYNPTDFGAALDEDFEGDYNANEFLIFLGYGITDRLVLEIEAAYITAELEKADEDLSTMPREIKESGLGDVQTQLDYYWLKETAKRPGFYSYFETVYPFNSDKDLTGTPDYEFKLGTGVIRGFSFGTLTFRVSAEYNMDEEEFGLNEVAVEYLKRLNDNWKVFLAVENDEAITEIQFHFADWGLIKFNNSFGLTPTSVDWAPEYGLMFSFHRW